MPASAAVVRCPKYCLIFTALLMSIRLNKRQLCLIHYTLSHDTIQSLAVSMGQPRGFHHQWHIDCKLLSKGLLLLLLSVPLCIELLHMLHAK